MNRFFVGAEILGDNDLGDIHAWAEDEGGNPLPPPDFGRPLKRRVIPKATPEGLERLLDDIDELEDDYDPILP